MGGGTGGVRIGGTIRGSGARGLQAAYRVTVEDRALPSEHVLRKPALVEVHVRDVAQAVVGRGFVLAAPLRRLLGRERYEKENGEGATIRGEDEAR